MLLKAKMRNQQFQKPIKVPLRQAKHRAKNQALNLLLSQLGTAPPHK